MVAANPSRRRPNRLVDLQAMKQEVDVLNRFRHDLMYRSVRDRLLSATGIDDGELLDELIAIGVTADNYEAIRFAPVGAIAWVNGGTRRRDRLHATKTLFEHGLVRSRGASRLLKSWLSKRPPANLMDLWRRYMQETMQHGRSARDVLFGENLKAIATRVALASGGMLKVDGICDREQDILAQITKVFDLRQSYAA